MGFRNGAYCTVWDEPKVIADTLTTMKASISRKDKSTGKYETDWSGFISFCGTAAAGKAAKLSSRDRIKLGDIDVSSKYDKEQKREYTHFKCFGFELLEQDNLSEPQEPKNEPEEDGVLSDGEVPF